MVGGVAACLRWLTGVWMCLRLRFTKRTLGHSASSSVLLNPCALGKVRRTGRRLEATVRLKEVLVVETDEKEEDVEDDVYGFTGSDASRYLKVLGRVPGGGKRRGGGGYRRR